MPQPRGFPPLPHGWVSHWETFPSADNRVRLFCVQHYPQEQKERKSCKRALLIVHGLGEHGGRYLHAAHYLQKSVDRVICLDLRGHGRSEGLRGHVDQFDEHVDDLATAIKQIHSELKREFGSTELHLLGHSMGGLVTLRTLQKYPDLPLVSVSVSSPLLKIRVKIPVLKKYAGLALARLWGTLHMTSEVNPDHLSHDREVGATYRADRLVHAKVTPLFFVQLEKAMADCVSHDQGIRPPLQFLIPLEDPIVDPGTSQDYFRRLDHPQKQLKTFPGFFHEPFNEIGKEKVFADVASWIERWSQIGAKLGTSGGGVQ